MKYLAVLMGVALLGSPMTAQAAGEAISKADAKALQTIVKRTYNYNDTSYDSEYEPPDAPSLAAIRKECATLAKALDARDGDDASYGYCLNDYDRFCQCQDMQPAVLRRTLAITLTRRTPRVIDAEAKFRLFEEGDPAPMRLIFRFVKTPKGWAVADTIREDYETGRLESAEREPLLLSIADLRKELKRPPYKAPPPDVTLPIAG